MFKKNILFFAFLLFANYSFSQTPYFYNYSIREGLPASEVYHVLQDSKGYLWFSTNYGVSKYDGYTFKNYGIKDGLTENTVFVCYEDEKKRIWFLGLSGKLSYYNDGKIYQYKYNDTILKYVNTAYFFTKSSFRAFNNDSISIDYREASKISIDSLGNFKIYDNSEVQIEINDYGHYIEQLNFKRTKFDGKTRFKINNNYYYYTDSLGIYRSYIVKNYNNNKIIWANYQLLVDFTDANNIKKRKIDYIVNYLYFDKNDDLWVGTDNGAYRFKDGDILKEHDYKVLDNQKISSVLQDNEDAMWFTSLENGAYYWLNNEFYSYLKEDEIGKINSIVSDNKRLYAIANNNMLYIIENQKISKHKLNNIANRYFYRIDISPNNEISVFDGRYRKLINLNNGKLEKKTTLWGNLSCIYHSQYTNNTRWEGTVKSINKRVDDKLVFASDVDMNFKKRVISIFEYDINNVLFGTVEGLWLFKHNAELIPKGEFIYLGDNNQMFETRVNYIMQNPLNNHVWLGTKGNGIIVYDFDNDKLISHISDSDGLQSNNISKIYFENNNVWVGTNQGFNKIVWNNDNSYTIEKYSISDGLIDNEVNDIISFNNDVYIATNKGLSLFKQLSSKKNDVKTPVYITGVKILNNDTTIQTHYNLNHYQNSISISYTGISYRNLGKLKYKYLLQKNGEQAEWVYTSNRNLNFPYLPSGEYSFFVAAINENGTEFSETASITFVIDLPFWQKIWFKALLIMGVLTIIISVAVIRIRVVKNKNKLITQLNNSMLQSLNSQINPHFIYNSLNSINNYILKSEKIKGSTFLSMFAMLMRQILNNSQHNFITIKQELEALKIYIELEALRFNNSFEYIIEIDETIDIETNKIPPLLIQPLIENAILHGILESDNKCLLKVLLKKEQNKIVCIIEDNGIGINKSMQNKKEQEFSIHKSLGSKITAERLQLINSIYKLKLNYNIIDLSDIEEGTGTRVVISFPIIK